MNAAEPGFQAPFPSDYRRSGILLHVTSLPSRFGIGDLGPVAFAWIDRLATAGQAWWQVLPLGPTGYGHSPYQALSSFAANPLILSPEGLVADGLLTEADCNGCAFASGPTEFDKVIPFKQQILERAWQNYRGSRHHLRIDFEEFCAEKGALQAEPALFMALREKFQAAPVYQWPQELIRREPKAIAQARRDCAEAIERFRFGQFLVFRQWKFLKQHANQRGVRLLGDMPIFVSPDSCDVWVNPELFLVDEQLKPKVMAGVPPDYFSADGQLWGNPIYDWNALKQTGYRWWIERLRSRLDHLDAIRIDHFRGFEAAWHVPAGASTAASGQWAPGPGAEFFEQARQELGGLPLLAEDLGLITPEVTALRDQFQLPGMRVLQFAFNGDPNNPHLPQHCAHNSVLYTGTHDNDTTLGWYNAAPEHERQNLWKTAQRSPGEPREAVWEMIRIAFSSEAALAIIPLQDLLGLDSSARMNIPGHADDQWRWRCSEDALGGHAWDRLLEMTQATNRATYRNSL